jgi:hypothetical protein
MTMNIVNAQFTATGSINALVDGIQMSIPADNGNRHYRELIEQGIEIAPYVEPAPTADQVRAERDQLLAKTDWVVTKSYEINTTIPQEWLNYRQALRDIPQQTGFPDNVVWPTAPEIG